MTNLKLYPMKQFQAMQFRRKGWLPHFRTGWIAAGKVVIAGRTKKEAVSNYRRALYLGSLTR